MPDLDVAHVLGLDRGRGDHRPVQRVGRDAVQVEPDRLEAGRVGRVGVDALRECVRRGDLSRQIGVVHVGLVGLRREDRLLQGNQRRVGRLQATVDLLVEVDVLLVVVEAQSRQQAQPIGERQLDLAEHGRAGVAVVDELVEAVAVEQPRRRSGGRRRQQHARRGRALLLLERRIRDRSSGGTRTRRRRSSRAAKASAGVADLLAPLPLLRRRRRHRRDRQPDEVAIVRRIPVPVAPAGGRGQHAAANLPVDVHRRPAEVLVASAAACRRR